MPRILLTVPLFTESRYTPQHSHDSTQMPSEESWVAGESSPQWDAPQRKWTIRWGLVSQKQCQIEQKAQHTHRGAGCACYRTHEQRSAQQDNCGRVTQPSTQPGSTSYHLGGSYNGWGTGKEGHTLCTSYSLLPQRVLFRRDKMPSAPLFNSFECLGLFLQTACW